MNKKLLEVTFCFKYHAYKFNTLVTVKGNNKRNYIQELLPVTECHYLSNVV